MTLEKRYNDLQNKLIIALIARPDEISRVGQFINENDFEVKELKNTLTCLKSWDSNPEIDYFSYEAIIDEFNKHHLDIPSNLKELFVYANYDGISDPPVIWAKRLKQQKALVDFDRQISGLKEQINSEKNISIQDLLSDSMHKTEVIFSGLVEDETVPISDTVEEIIKETQENSTVKKIPSPYKQLDAYTGGWGKGQLITVAARTGIGKSIFAVNCASHAALNNYSVLFFSLEMGQKELVKRIIASELKIDLKEINLNSQTDKIKEIKEFNNVIKEKDSLRIDDTPNMTIDYIRSKAVKQSKTEEGLDLVIIDYLQLIQHSAGRYANRQESVAEMSRAMKLLAKELQVPVIIVAQLNRESRNDDEDALPTIADIRESGAIANDSDVIILIHKIRKKSDENAKDALFILGKNRHGPANKKIKVYAEYSQSRFDEITLEQEYNMELGKEVYKTEQTGYTQNNANQQGSDFSDTQEVTQEEDIFSNILDEDIFSELDGGI